MAYILVIPFYNEKGAGEADAYRGGRSRRVSHYQLTNLITPLRGVIKFIRICTSRLLFCPLFVLDYYSVRSRYRLFLLLITSDNGKMKNESAAAPIHSFFILPTVGFFHPR